LVLFSIQKAFEERREGKCIENYGPLDGSELAECILPNVKAFIKKFPLTVVAFVRVVEPIALSTSAGSSMLKDKRKIEATRKASAREYLK
jgi:hypothetical protein